MFGGVEREALSGILYERELGEAFEAIQRVSSIVGERACAVEEAAEDVFSKKAASSVFGKTFNQEEEY